MQIGVVYPQTELQGDPTAVREMGLAVERLGFDHLLAYDHVVGAVHADRERPLPGPYSELDPFHDPLVMFGYLAGITDRIGFASGVMVLPQRPTALVARQAADVDLLSGGRLRLGIGVGWNHVEYEALGYDFRGRGRRQEEQIDVLRRLFTDPVVDFTGSFHRLDRVSLNPKPGRPVPIWLGGSSDVAFDRAARLADGFMFFGGGPADTVDAWDKMRVRLRDLDRSVGDFGADWVALPGGGVETVVTQVDAWRDAGGTHISLSTMGLGLDSIAAHIDYLTSIAIALELR
jgi:probable F420-dependent oxidoreductase